MVAHNKNFENISINIYENGSLIKVDERYPDTNLFNDVTKQNFVFIF